MFNGGISVQVEIKDSVSEGTFTYSLYDPDSGAVGTPIFTIPGYTVLLEEHTRGATI